jgi:hypothetical protein
LIFTATSIKSGGVNLSWLYRYELNLYWNLYHWNSFEN